MMTVVDHVSPCREVKVVFGNGRQDAPLHADHRADKGVDDDQRGELCEVFTQPKAHCGNHRRGC